MEDINNILNQGEVPNIFAYEEKMEILDRIRNVAKQKMGRKVDSMNQNDLYEYFLSRLTHKRKHKYKRLLNSNNTQVRCLKLNQTR